MFVNRGNVVQKGKIRRVKTDIHTFSVAMDRCVECGEKQQYKSICDATSSKSHSDRLNHHFTTTQLNLHMINSTETSSSCECFGKLLEIEPATENLFYPS